MNTSTELPNFALRMDFESFYESVKFEADTSRDISRRGQACANMAILELLLAYESAQSDDVDAFLQDYRSAVEYLELADTLGAFETVCIAGKLAEVVANRGERMAEKRLAFAA